MSKALNKYIRDIKIIFPIMQLDEKDYIECLKIKIMKNANYQNMTYQDFIDEYGSPINIYTMYLKEVDINDFIFRIERCKKRRRIFLTILTLLTLFVILLSFWQDYCINEFIEQLKYVS